MRSPASLGTLVTCNNDAFVAKDKPAEVFGLRPLLLRTRLVGWQYCHYRCYIDVYPGRHVCIREMQRRNIFSVSQFERETSQLSFVDEYFESSGEEFGIVIG